jgi:hypothetical protein
MRSGVRTGLVLLGCAVAAPAIAGDPAPIGGVKLVQPVTIPLVKELRVRMVVPPSEPNWRMQGPQSLTRKGAGGALVDFYPFDDNFHLSAGGRLFNRGGTRSADPASLTIAPAQRTGLSPSRKFTPTMLMGYSRTGASGVAVGVDAGVMVGQSDPSPDYRLRNAEGPRAPNGLNRLARVTVRAPF